jgi:hypothetical protein
MNEIYSLYAAHIQQENQARFEALHSYLEEEDLTIPEFFEKRVLIMEDMEKCRIDGKLKRLAKLEKDFSRMEEVFCLAEEFASRNNPSNAYSTTGSRHSEAFLDAPPDYTESVPPIPPPSSNDFPSGMPRDSATSKECPESREQDGACFDSEPQVPPPLPAEAEQMYYEEEEIFHDCPGDFDGDISSSSGSAAPGKTNSADPQTFHHTESKRPSQFPSQRFESNADDRNPHETR